MVGRSLQPFVGLHASWLPIYRQGKGQGRPRRETPLTRGHRSRNLEAREQTPQVS